MNADTSLQADGSADGPEVAFAAMTRKLAALTAAVEGFASRQQELHARDYGPDLAKVLERCEKARVAILTLADRPAMKLTPEVIASQIEDAGATGRSADHHAWMSAHRDLGQSIRTLDDVVASANTAYTQRLWIAGAAALAIVVGFAFGTVIPTRIAQAVPESWYWPEVRAASFLQRNGWDAGLRLLHVADPARSREMMEAVALVDANAQVIADCRSRVPTSGKPKRCGIKLPAPSSGGSKLNS